jgi:hypothetical protein
MMTGVTLTSTSTVVALDIVERIDFSTSRKVATYIFGDGTESILDEGKNVDHIIIHGVDYGEDIEDPGAGFPLTFSIGFFPQYTYRNPSIKMDLLNGIMDDQEDVTVSGLENSNLNTDYLITDLEFNQEAGESTVPLYRFSLTLERKYDQLG